MKKFLLIGLIIIPVLLILANILPTQNAGVSVTVLMKKDSFDPETITIKKGTTVEFKNVDTLDKWPASNIHPTHTIYPEFDPLQPINPGSSWSFTFNKVGKWSDHDHLDPSIRGTIIVTE